MQLPTGPLCDGCHSVNYNIRTRAVTEWNVGCEKCHGPGGAHVKQRSRANIVNAARLSPVQAANLCIHCHSQGQPLANPINGRYNAWPVGFHAGLDLKDFWKLEDNKLGEQSFTHFADGTAHKNRMQGNDFVQSVMYTRGVTCNSCHDVHGTGNNADLIKPANVLRLECHGPESPNGPHAGTIEAHTHHAAGSAGNECVSCHMPKIEQTNRGRQRPGAYVQIHHSERDSYPESPQCVCWLSRGQARKLGGRYAADMVKHVALEGSQPVMTRLSSC
jgi:predicted CXXCH cytochrome family protein